MELKGIGLGNFEYSWVGYRMLLVLLLLACGRMIFELGVLIKELIERYREICKFLDREEAKTPEGKEGLKEQKEETKVKKKQ